MVGEKKYKYGNFSKLNSKLVTLNGIKINFC